MTRPAKPRIFSRAQWGANERMRESGPPDYGTVKTGFVHHTVNANGYSRAQVPSLLRGIYAYHTQSRGWRDIGYNFLVDRFGRIWEGRYGGVQRAVVGAHTLGYNEVSFAMSAIGNFETVRPRPAMVAAYARLFAWKLAIYNIRANNPRVTVKGRTFHAINGHRDAGQTACPGRYLYARLPYIRKRAREIQLAAQRGVGSSGTSTTPPPPATTFTSPTQTAACGVRATLDDHLPQVDERGRGVVPRPGPEVARDRGHPGAAHGRADRVPPGGAHRGLLVGHEPARRRR